MSEKYEDAILKIKINEYELDSGDLEAVYSYQQAKIDQLEAKNKKLEEREKKLIECVEFYANNVTSAFDINGEFELEQASECARQTLKELGINNE